MRRCNHISYGLGVLPVLQEAACVCVIRSIKMIDFSCRLWWDDVCICLSLSSFLAEILPYCFSLWDLRNLEFSLFLEYGQDLGDANCAECLFRLFEDTLFMWFLLVLFYCRVFDVFLFSLFSLRFDAHYRKWMARWMLPNWQMWLIIRKYHHSNAVRVSI